MADKVWKQRERSVARALGGTRIPVSGRGDGPDVDCGWLVVEVKHRKELPQWLKAALSQAHRAAKRDQLAIAVLHEAGDHDSIVCLKLKDFVAWFGDGGQVEA